MFGCTLLKYINFSPPNIQILGTKLWKLAVSQFGMNLGDELIANCEVNKHISSKKGKYLGFCSVASELRVILSVVSESSDEQTYGLSVVGLIPSRGENPGRAPPPSFEDTKNWKEDTHRHNFDFLFFSKHTNKVHSHFCLIAFCDIYLLGRPRWRVCFFRPIISIY